MDLVAEMLRERKRKEEESSRSRSERQGEAGRGNEEDFQFFPLDPVFLLTKSLEIRVVLHFGRILYVYLFLFLSVGVF